MIKRSYRRKTSITVIGVTALFSLNIAICAVAQAPPPPQAVDQATREVDKSIRETAERRMAPQIKTPVLKEEQPVTESKGPKFFVKNIKLEGTVSFPAEDFSPILEKYVGRELTINDLKIVSSAIEREYLKRGIIASCFLPPQDVEKEQVTLRVVEAKFGKLQINEHGRFFDPDRIKYYWNIKPGEVLKYDKMSKSSQMMNKNPDRTVGLTLHAGELPETTDVLMDVITRFPVHIFGSFDREGSVPTGRIRTGLGIRHNNFLFIDDSLMIGTTFGKDFISKYIYHLVPITPFGTSIMYGFSDSRSAPKKEFERFVIKSESQNYSVYLKQDIYQKDEYHGEVSVGVDANDKTSKSLATVGTMSRERLRILRFKSTLLHRFPGAITSVTPQLSQGLNWLGARRKNAFSSREATNTLTKFNFDIRHRRQFPMDLQAVFNLRSQWAGEKLASQEQFGMGGINSVRGYPSQDYMADTGIVTNFELIFPSFWIPEEWKIPYESKTLRDSVAAFAFFDWGWGKKRGDIQGERHLNYMAGAGLGLRIKMFNQASLQLAWGFPLPFADKPLTESASSRFHISLDFEDQFYDEFQRIAKISEDERMNRLSMKLLDAELNRQGSPLRTKVYGTMLMALKAEEHGDLVSASSYYAELLRIGRNIENQALDYVVKSFENEKSLREMNKKANKAYKTGNIMVAKSLWEELILQANIQPLILDL